MKGDKAVRYNLFVVSLIFFNFWSRLLSLRIKNTTAAFWVALLAPSAALLIPVLVYPFACLKPDGRRGFGTRFSECYTMKKCGVKNLFLSVFIGIFAYIFYIYTYSSAVCFYEYAAKTVSVYTYSVSFDWRLTAVWALQGVLVPFLTELAFRGAGNAVYGETRLKFVAPVLFGLFMSFSADGWTKGLIAGIFAVAVLSRSESVWSSVVISVLFSLLHYTIGNFFIFPFSFQTVSSVETALFFGFVSMAVAIFALGAATLGVMSMSRRAETKKGKIQKNTRLFRLSADGRITAGAVVVVYSVLSLVLALI